jgi:hypothetical protein
MKLYLLTILFFLLHVVATFHQGACLGNFELKYNEISSTNYSTLSLRSRTMNGYHFVTFANNLSNPLQGKYFTFLGHQNKSVMEFYLQVGNRTNVKPENFSSSKVDKFFYYDVIQQNFIFPTSFFNFGEIGNFSTFIKVGGSTQKPRMENGSIFIPNVEEEFIQKGSVIFSKCYRPLQNVELYHPAAFSGN